MKLLRGFQDISLLAGGAVATIGNFDGVHVGHRALLGAVRTEALKRGLPSLVVLFEPQPAEYLNPSKAPARLSTLREKLDELRLASIDYVYCLRFNRTLSQMPADVFAQQVIFSKLRIKSLFIGQDFRFGAKRAGDVALLRQLAVSHQASIHTVTDFSVTGERVSSTRVRQTLQAGNLEAASLLLGRTYSLWGRVVAGRGVGRQWGVPTANLNLSRLALPVRGVFCVRAHRPGKPDLWGVANIGCRPTVDGTKNILEIHFFNLDESIYGEWLQVFFLHKLRDEVKFSSVNALIEQIHADVVAAKAYLEYV